MYQAVDRTTRLERVAARHLLTYYQCNSEQPCAQCSSQSLACVYDGADGRRGHKRTLQDAQQEREKLQTLFERLRDSDALSASMLYARIRQGEAVAELIQYTNDSEVARATDEASIERAVVTMLSGTQIAFEGAIEYIVPTANNDLWETTLKVKVTPRPRVQLWTQVGVEKGLVKDLIDLYFCWCKYLCFGTLRPCGPIR